MNPEQNKAMSRKWHEAWSTGDIERAYREYLHPDFRVLFFGHGWVDRETYIAQDRAFMSAFSDIRIKVEEMVAEGETVVCRMTWAATHTGQLQGIQPTGKRFEVMGFGLDRYRDGIVVEHIPLFDQFSQFKQLGLIEDPSE